MQLEEGDPALARWWPELRRIDVTGLVLVAAFLLWVWLAARATGGSAGPLIALVVGSALLAALARWATHLHATGPAAALAVALLGYGLMAGVPADPLATERLGALLAIGTGAGAIVAVRATELWLRLAGGVVGLTLAWLTWRTGSTPATLIAGFVVVAAVALAALPMRERRWVLVWPALAAVTILFGTVAYAALPLPAELVLDAPDPDRLEGWKVALDTATEEPLFGAGPGAPAPDDGVDDGASSGWARHEPLQIAAETGAVGGLLFLAVLAWAVVWIARPGGGPGQVIGAVVFAGSIAHACLVPIWRAPAVPLALALLAGVASTRGGAARWRLDALLDRARGTGASSDVVGTT